MLKNPAVSFGVRHRRLGAALIALSAVAVLPWTVTAQQASQSTMTVSAKKTAARRHHSAPSHHVPAPAARKLSVANGALALAGGHPARALASASARSATTEWAVKIGVAPAPIPAARATSIQKAAGAAPAVPAPPSPTFAQVYPPLPAVPVAPATRTAAPAVGVDPRVAFQSPPAPAAAANGLSRTIPARIVNPAVPTSPAPNGSIEPAISGPTSVGVGGTDFHHPVSEVHAMYVDGPVPHSSVLRLSVHFEGVPLYKALQDLFREADVDFSISSDVEYDNVTCTLHMASIQTALSTILKACARQHVTYSVENGVYEVTNAEPHSPRPGLGGGSD